MTRFTRSVARTELGRNLFGDPGGRRPRRSGRDLRSLPLRARALRAAGHRRHVEPHSLRRARERNPRLRRPRHGARPAPGPAGHRPRSRGADLRRRPAERSGRGAHAARRRCRPAPRAGLRHHRPFPSDGRGLGRRRDAARSRRRHALGGEHRPQLDRRLQPGRRRRHPGGHVRREGERPRPVPRPDRPRGRPFGRRPLARPLCRGLGERPSRAPHARGKPSHVGRKPDGRRRCAQRGHRCLGQRVCRDARRRPDREARSRARGGLRLGARLPRRA